LNVRASRSVGDGDGEFCVAITNVDSACDFHIFLQKTVNPKFSILALSGNCWTRMYIPSFQIAPSRATAGQESMMVFFLEKLP
jgi:hypothetical protein